MARQGAVASGRYRMANEGQSSQRGLQGMYVLRDGAGMQIFRPTWQGTRTVFRPFPGKDPEDPTRFDPFRLSDEDRDFGDWIRRYDMAFSFGVPGITFILKDPLDKTVDDQQSPVWMLYRSITQAVKSGQGLPAWNPLIFGATGRAAPLSAPKDGYLMQGILMEHKSVVQDPPRGCALEHQPVLLLMSQSAGEALIHKLSERNEDGSYRWPDLVNLDAGMFIQFHQAGTQSQHAGAPRQMNATAKLGEGNAADNNRYEVEFLETYSGILPSYDGIHEVAAAHVKPWDDIVRIPTIEEQVRMLCGAGIPATAIVYALADAYGDFIPQHIFDQARAQQGGTGAPAAPAGNPMARGGAPMGRMATDTKQDPSMPSAQPSTRSAGMGAKVTTPAQTPPAEETETAEFDPQPSHAAPERTRSTMDALARARARAAAAQQ